MHIKSSRQVLPSKRPRTFKDSPIDREGCFWCPMQARNTTYSTPTICIPTFSKIYRCHPMSSNAKLQLLSFPDLGNTLQPHRFFAHACLRSTAVSMAKRPRALRARVICTGLPNWALCRGLGKCELRPNSQGRGVDSANWFLWGRAPNWKPSFRNCHVDFDESNWTSPNFECYDYISKHYQIILVYISYVLPVIH